MASINFRETALWIDAKALLIESYRVTQGWPTEGQELAKDIRSVVRQILRAVPRAFQKSRVTGMVHLEHATGQFAELEALCEAAVTLGFVEPSTLDPLLTLSEPVQAEFKILHKAATEKARELMKARTNLFGAGLGDEEDA